MSGGHRREISRGYRRTTNNRMELLAVITALEALRQPSDVELYSDSEYVVNAIRKGWLDSWQRRGWRKADRSPVLNVDLWQRLIPLLKRHNINFNWVRGHNENLENERCDRLAVDATRSAELLIDEGFNGG